MKKKKEELYLSISKFFQDCENKITELKISPPLKSIQKNSYDSEKKQWSAFYITVPNWYLIRWNHGLETIHSIALEKCIEILLQILLPPKWAKTLPEKDLDNIRRNKDHIKSLLLSEFIKYKEQKEEFGISMKFFLTILVEDVYSKTLSYNFKANLIGIDIREDIEFDIGDFKIRKLKVSEKLEMMNNLKSGFRNFDTSQIAVSYEDCMPYNNWIIKSGNIEIQSNGRSDFNNPKIELESFSSDLELVFLAFRLSGFQVGIRDWLIKEGRALQNSKDFYSWSVNRYKYGDFHKMTTDSRNSMSWKINIGNKRFEINDIKKIQNNFNLLSEYYRNPVEQLSIGLNAFSRAFEQVRPELTFSDLVIAYEAFLSKPPKKKEKNEILETIVSAETKSQAKKVISMLQGKGINESVSILRMILPGKNSQKVIDFFESGKENSVFTIRNEIFHGNTNGNIDAICKILPQFTDYLRELILRLIVIHIEKKVDFDDGNYYEKLYEFFKK